MSPQLIKRSLAAAALLAAAAGAAYFWNPSVVAPARRAIAARLAGPTQFGWAARVAPLAGAGAPGYVDGAAALARFADPYGIAIDAAGDTYVADAGDNNRIRKIARDGTVSTFAGSREGYADGPAAAAAFHTPSGLAFDGKGSLLVADTGNNAIRRISAQGVVSTLAGTGTAGYRDGPAAQAQFNGPVGVAVDASGNVYVADTYNDRIRRIAPDGQVSTVAGGARPGLQDGSAHEALFDTPTALAAGRNGELYVADTANDAIRKIGADGQVTTLAHSPAEERDALLRRPLGLALTHDGHLYIGEGGRGRILQLAPDGRLGGLTGVGIDIEIGDSAAPRLGRPTSIALARGGVLHVADGTQYGVRQVGPAGTSGGPAAQAAVPTAPAAPTTTPFPWPVEPQHAWHEIVGIIGEVRGDYEGESRHHFHSGIDVQAAMGTPVLAIAAEKVSSPIPNWGHGSLSEGLRIDKMAYIHMRVGRTARDAPLDPARFVLLGDDKGKPERVRIKRGTRFAIGDRLGTVNRMFHVHLEYRPAGTQVNPLALAFDGFADTIAPHIDSITLHDEAGQRLGKKKDGSLVVPRAAGDLSIVVDAHDKMDGNIERRRLGLYQLGYQVLRRDGTPVRGFEQPLLNLEFNRLPPDRESVKVAYADKSGITVHGNAATRFLYVVTNTVRDGAASTGAWRPSDLSPGDYTIRIFAFDYAGNQAMAGRDLPITLE